MALLFFCYQMLWIITIILITSIFLENDWIENISLEITECYVKTFVGKTCIEVDFSSPLLLSWSGFMFHEGRLKQIMWVSTGSCPSASDPRNLDVSGWKSLWMIFTFCVLGEIAVGTRECLSVFPPGPNRYKLTPSSFSYGPMKELCQA